MNCVCLIGRMVRDPELRTTTTGKSVCSFTLAVQKQFKPQDGSAEADFINVVAWNKQAEYVTNHLTKGRMVSVVGRIQTRSYNASDGSRRDVTEILCEQVSGLDRPREDSPQPAAQASLPGADEYDPFADD